MLQRNMDHTLGIHLGLDDLLADLHYARREQELGRLALLAYCEVKGWARQAGKPDIADDAMKMFTETPCSSRDEFLADLTPRERDVLSYLFEGAGCKEVATQLQLSTNTVRSHLQSLMAKFGVHSTLELVALTRSRLEALPDHRQLRMPARPLGSGRPDSGRTW